MHRKSGKHLLLTTSLLLLASLASAQNNPCNGLTQGPEGSLNGFVPFPSNSLWNTNIANAPVDPNSDAIINFIGGSKPLHPDFGAGLYNGQTIGIPYVVVPVNQPLANINFTAYGDQSDPGPMPIPLNAQIEGYPNPDDGDRHVLVIDKGNCWLYELYRSYQHGPGLWYADSAAVWDLEANEMRPYTWTSADAAGLPILPGLVRYDEVAAGAINHAIRVTLQYSKQAFTPPASHWAANSSNTLAAPMGMRLRLKASFDISGYPPDDRVILTALKQYGMIMADNGNSMFITGTVDPALEQRSTGSTPVGDGIRFRGAADLAVVHAAECADRPESHHQQLHGNRVRRHGTAGHVELECDQWGILRRFAIGGSNSRQYGGGVSAGYNDVHVVCDQSVWEDDGAGYGYGAVEGELEGARCFAPGWDDALGKPVRDGLSFESSLRAKLVLSSRAQAA